MRMSNLFGMTLRAAPGKTEAEGHQMLLRAAFVRQLGTGIFSFLPLGWRSLKKIENVIREEMDAAGGLEMLMPVVHPAELWKATGRYYTVGPELARFKDRRGRDVVLAMTHEEVVAELCKGEINSYRDLPRLVYHIQTKFRDDPRPRAGLIRVREFTMKDAYSLATDEAGLDAQYRVQYQAYFNIFNRCALPVIAVGSDVGMMGGSLAHEFMYLTPIGEDTLVLCDNCGYSANRQVAAFAKPKPPQAAALPLERVATPGTATIDSLAAFLRVPANKTAKAMFMATERERRDGSFVVEPIVAIIRGDHELNETKLANAVKATDLRPMTEEEIAQIGAVPGYGSPIGVTGATVVIDDLAASSPNLVAGANEEGYHLLNSNHGRDYTANVVADIIAAGDGDACVVCGTPLRTTRGVEAGNIFKLGSRYSAAVGATFLGPDGQEHPVVMGSYGIGLDRLLACAAEEHHDSRGLRLPITIAPAQVHICRLGAGRSPAAEIADRLYAELQALGVEVLYDDRGERPGVQFADADLIGVPLRVTVGEKSLARGGVEVRRRDGDTVELVPVEKAPERLTGEIRGMFEEIAAKVVPVVPPDPTP
ncbi:MAG TPA: proline--tRNA ligase [Streptosporangiaceae bacterium]|nr:proline--tRNA ligase [Streptosporangiaceae bacterium]